MDSLELLASCIEQGRTTIAPALADASERKRLEQLQALGALVPARAQAIICPRCEARSVRVITAGSAFCIECGQVALALKDTQRLSPDGDWLRRRIAQTLGLAGEPAWMMVPGRVWRIGDIGTAAHRRRILFGQQLGDMMVQKVLLATWPTHVGETQAVIVTTSPTDRVFLPGVPAAVVPLTAAFRLRGGGLVADEAVWAGVQAQSRRVMAQSRNGPFAHDFGDVLLLGENELILLTRTQSAILRVLWELGGTSIGREMLIRRADVTLSKPIDAFPRNKYPEANRAYHALVRSERHGQYWLPRFGRRPVE